MFKKKSTVRVVCISSFVSCHNGMCLMLHFKTFLWSSRRTRGLDKDDALRFKTVDGNDITVDITISWHIDSTMAPYGFSSLVKAQKRYKKRSSDLLHVQWFETF